jgi:transcriptional antiterminator NusG
MDIGENGLDALKTDDAGLPVEGDLEEGAALGGDVPERSRYPDFPGALNNGLPWPDVPDLHDLSSLSGDGAGLSAAKKNPAGLELDYEDEGDEGQGKAKWYVVHTYSGHENKVKANIEKIVENRGMQDFILKIIVPTEDRVEIKNGQRKLKTRKMFPGYVLIKMVVTNESWYLVRNTQGVTGFVGHGSEPVPLTRDEVRRMGIEKIYIDLGIEIGDSVKVINGPFESFMGVVEEVNMERQTLKTRISMFGRDTPVELEFGQVDKI